MKNSFFDNILKNAKNDANEFIKTNGKNSLRPPLYDAESYVDDLVKDKYFSALAIVRHYVKLTSDTYWSEVGAFNIDLFMLTPSSSSPVGPGSDSEVISIQFGKYHTKLTDSSQFGFEPLMFHLDKAYCYLPSMRGENPDARHLNQFFHCEAEITGTLDELLPYVEDYVQALARTFVALTPLIRLMSIDFSKTEQALQNIIKNKNFNKKTFDEVYPWLQENSSFHIISNFGRSVTSSGEVALAQHMGDGLPIWLCNYDRDTVPFYQKPNPKNTNSVINADLIFAPIVEGGFGGEIVGSGQRQDNSEEIIESLERQKVDGEPYEWYINLRKQPNYKTTSGFGLGIERFIAWALGYSNIKDVIHYPRLKNIKTLP
jgi:asparaginyl-tRNA synthetase